MTSSTTVTIVGAGPYGLSLASHLGKSGIPFRIFGPPMDVWQTQMPAGMHLKSDGFASDLYDPDREFTLKRYCKEHGIAYADYGLPVHKDTFVAYALEFQKKFAAGLDRQPVVELRKDRAGYSIRLEDGEVLTSKAVVVATGISYFGCVPAPLNTLHESLCTHSSAHNDLSGFKNRRVVVLGGGASATDLAALLLEAGSSVRIVARRPLKFHLPPSTTPQSLWKKIREPNLGLGPGLKSAFYTAAPDLFYLLPRTQRHRIVRHHLGPAGGWFIKDQVLGKVQSYIGYDVRSATESNGAVRLDICDIHGEHTEIEVDHVIAATGYQPSIDRLTFIDPALRARIKQEANSPRLSRSFESSVAGLYFIGVAAACNFGPLMRFARGAEFAANRVARHLQRSVASEAPIKSGQEATA
jgi:thioredoxin reductase